MLSLIVLLILGFVLLGKYKPVWAFYAAIALAPWQELMVDVGLRVSLYTLSLLGVFSAVFCSRGSLLGRDILNRKWVFIYAFVGWATLDTLAHLQFSSEVIVNGGLLRSPTIRPFVQIISMLVMLAPVICAPVMFRLKIQLVSAVNIFLVSVTVLILLGWYQLLNIKYLNYDPLPMGFINAWFGGPGVVRSGLDSGPGNSFIYRMSSLGGEPRYLAQSAAAALLLIQVFFLGNNIKYKGLYIILYINLIAGLFATMSISGIYLWATGFLALLIIYVFSSKGDFLSILNNGRYMHFLSFFVAALIFLSLIGNFEWGYLVSRIMRRGVIADFDRVVFDFLVAEPKYVLFGVGLGNVHLHADPYLQPYFRDFAGATSFVADSGWLRLISELGIIGLFMFLMCLINLFSYFNKNVSAFEKFGDVKILKCLFLIGAFGYLARGNTFAPIAFMLIGLSIAPAVWDDVHDRGQFDD